MQTSEFNKMSMAVLSVCLLTLGLNMISGIVFTPKKPIVPGIEIAGEPAQVAAAGPAVAEEPIAVRLVAADKARGEKAVGACKACHAFEKGGGNKVGPALWDVFERGKASVAGFGYSVAAKGKSSEAWTAANLDGFLKNPKAYLPGTSMAFAGVGKPEQRADIVSYLNSLADAPKALPKP
jgi:cytochrome c